MFPFLSRRPPTRVVQMTELGSRGRWGNQLFQYAFAHAYARKHHARLEVPEWLGERVFDLRAHRPSCELPKVKLVDLVDGQTGIDLSGFFQHERALGYYSRADARRLFRVRREWIRRFPRREGYYIAAHVRRGDYASFHNQRFCLVSRPSYRAAIEQFALDRKRVVWVTEETSSTADDLVAGGLDFLEDFLTLMRADVVLRANSTFSWWAATLGTGMVYSPVVGSHVGVADVPFVEGNHPRLLDTANPYNRADIHSELHLRER